MRSFFAGQQFIDKTVGCRLTKQSIQTAAVASSKFETFDKSKKKVQSKFRLEARENYKTTTPTVSTFIMSTPTNVMLFGNHPARRLRCGVGPPLEPLSSSLFLLQLMGDSSFESFSARRIASFRRIFYKLGHFAKPSCCAGSLARMPRITASYITNAQQVERKERKEERRYRLRV